MNTAPRQITTRLLSLDIVRGYALLAMLLSHSTWRLPDIEYRVAFGWDNLIIPARPAPQNWIGYVLQSASPFFFLLAGFSMSLFIASCRKRGWSEWQISRFLFTRGLVLIALDLTIVNFDLAPHRYGYRLSVLTAIGISLCIFSVLRKLDRKILIVLMIILLLSTQLFYFFHAPPEQPSMLRAILLAPGGHERYSVEFQVLPWLPVIIMGYVSGSYFIDGTVLLYRYCIRMVPVLLSLWLLVIWRDGVGNLYRENRLIFGKHPPDLAYLLLYVGLAFLLIAFHIRFEGLQTRLPWRIIALFGQTPLFYYIIHIKILDLLSFEVKPLPVPELAQSFIMTLLAVPVLYVLCRWYADYKKRYPASLLRYL